MSQDTEKKSFSKQIVTALLIALIAGGSAPWWWNYVFGSHLSGTYDGTVTNNLTFRTSDLRLVISEDNSGKLTGSVNITGPLVGSAPLQGQRDGNQVGFTSVVNITDGESPKPTVMTWKGVLENDRIRGDFRASLPPEWKGKGATDQSGTWDVRKGQPQ